MEMTGVNDTKWHAALVSDQQRETIIFINMVVLCGVISMLGSVANVINMIVFYRQGLDTTINISFFSLAISDLCSLIFQQFFNIYSNPLLTSLNLPINYLDFQYITTGTVREMFARITCQITAFITAERCLCVVFPLHVKRILTPKISVVVIIMNYVLSLVSFVPLYSTHYFTWTFHPHLNTTLLSLAFKQHRDFAELFLYFTHGIFTFLSFLSVLIFTLMLIHKLRQKNVWRQTANVDQEKAKLMSKRDRATITMVVLIAGILVVCYTPAVLLSLATFLIPEFSFGPTKYYNLCYSLWTFAFLCENINSSVNIALYYKMSSKYRQTFRGLFLNEKCDMK